MGRGEFLKAIKAQLMSKARGRKIIQGEDRIELRESITPYRAFFRCKKRPLSPENAYYLDE